MRDKFANPDGLIAQLAGEQHGIVTTRQLRSAGIDKHGTTRRLKAGRLHRVHRGVYAVGHTRLSFEGRCLAAVLACGDGAALSHRGAAALWGMITAPSGRVDVTVPGDGGRAKRRGISVHRSVTLAEQVITMRRGIPVTRPVRTLVDLQHVASPAVFQRASRRALDLRLVREEELGNEPDLTRSELERMFLRLCRRRRLPKPEVNARLDRYEVDFLWRDARLVVETDGFRHHSHRAAFESDRARDARLEALGFRVLRFSYRQVRDSPAAVAASLRTVMAQNQ